MPPEALSHWLLSLAHRHDDYAYEVTPERVRRLSQLLFQPALYTQRFVDKLSFLPTGGQRWHRTLQIRIPEDAAPEHPSWWIIPLGEFKRRRLADIAVCDAEGTQLNLVTRQQHGYALTDVMTAKYARPLSDAQHHLLKSDLNAIELNEQFRSSVFSYLTNLNVPPDEWTEDASEPLYHICQRYEALLQALEVSETESASRARKFGKEFAKEAKTAPYLCWVKASPGEVVHLLVSYTAVDPKHKLDTGGFIDLLKSLSEGMVPVWQNGRKVRSGWYRQYGIAPIDYTIDVPTLNSRPASYYLMLEPPAHTAAAFLDWELGDSLDIEKEVDCALPAAHVYQGKDVDKRLKEVGATGKVRAYLRCSPYRHKQILGATALNVAVIWLLSKGELPVGFGEPLQGLIVAAPSVLVAFLAQQQRHYYSHVLRRQRAVLWIYLFISVSFLVSVAFSERDSASGSVGLSWWATDAAWALAISSAGIFAWHAPLGGTYERVVQYLTERKWEVRNQRPIDELGPLRRFGNDLRRTWWKVWRVENWTKWECYAASVRQYGNFICLITLVAMLGAVFLLQEYADFSLKGQATPGHARYQRVTETNTSNPNWYSSGKQSATLPSSGVLTILK